MKTYIQKIFTNSYEIIRTCTVRTTLVELSILRLNNELSTQDIWDEQAIRQRAIALFLSAKRTFAAMIGSGQLPDFTRSVAVLTVELCKRWSKGQVLFSSLGLACK